MTALNKQQLDIFKNLIKFDTTSDQSNSRLIGYVEDRLRTAGISSVIKQTNDQGTKTNLYASIGPQDIPGGIIFSGHTDTVPVTGQKWDTDPYQLIKKEDAFYARGSVDMKGFDALALSQLIDAAEKRKHLTRPLGVLLTYDEEIGCFGVQNFLKAHKDKLGDPALILVGEPTELHPVIAHKGIHCFEVTIAGQGGHSSNPNNGISAIKYGTEAAHLLYELQKEFERVGLKDNRFTPPYSTLNVGQIDGGTAVNIIADQCRLIFETRPIPGETKDVLLQKLDVLFDRASTETNGTLTAHIREYVSNPPFVGDAKALGTQLLIDTLDHKEPLAVPFMTEASALSDAGFNTVVCGPGNIEQAHQPNEFITCDQLQRGAQLLERLTQHCFEPL